MRPIKYSELWAKAYIQGEIPRSAVRPRLRDAVPKPRDIKLLAVVHDSRVCTCMDGWLASSAAIGTPVGALNIE